MLETSAYAKQQHFGIMFESTGNTSHKNGTPNETLNP